MCIRWLFALRIAVPNLGNGNGRRHLSVDEVISEVSLALAECRARIAHQVNDRHLAEAARKIEQALKLLKSIK